MFEMTVRAKSCVKAALCVGNTPGIESPVVQMERAPQKMIIVGHNFTHQTNSKGSTLFK